MVNNNQINQISPDYAGFWIRWVATLISALIYANVLMALALLVVLFASSNVDAFIQASMWFLLYAFFVQGLLLFFLNPYLISSTGGTLGKLAVGLEVVTDKAPASSVNGGRRLTFWEAVFREYIAKLASAPLLGLGYFWIFRDERRQGWHDMVAETYVLKHDNYAMTRGVIIAALLIGLFASIGFGIYNYVSGNEMFLNEISKLIQNFE